MQLQESEQEKEEQENVREDIQESKNFSVYR